MNNDPLIGTQLANFTVERCIGRGGMAQVYYGHDIKLQRAVAIKVIDARYRGNQTYAKRFVREARTIAAWLPLCFNSTSRISTKPATIDFLAS